MGTIRSAISDNLKQHGLWDDEAAAVMQVVVSAPELDTLEGRWDTDQGAYPPVIINIAWLVAKRKAVEWIDANKPQHFARSMLA